MPSLLKLFTDHVEKERLFDRSDKVLLAVSGGIDSVVMADLFAKAGYTFGIAHCNFQLRGKDSDSDEAFVKSLAEHYHVPIHCITFDTLAFAKSNKLSVEEAARKLRYDFFDDTIQNNDYQFVATAHHLNDSIETFFINLIRGTGIAGLHGIVPKNGKIVRPLLPFTRQEITQYASENSLQYHEDYTNNETVFLRNKIRHQVVPLLKQISPQIEQTMRQNLLNIAEAECVFRSSIAEKRQQLFQHDGEKIIISKNIIRGLTPRNTYMFELLRPYGFNPTTVSVLLSALDNTGKSVFSKTHMALVGHNDIIISPIEKVPSAMELSIPEGVEIVSNPIKLSFGQIEAKSLTDLHTTDNTIIVDSAKLKYPLVLRKWQANDRFRPFGMKGTRKVSDFFKDNHLTRLEKNEKWLLCNANGQIIWIVGMRMDDTFKVDKKTEHITIIQYPVSD